MHRLVSLFIGMLLAAFASVASGEGIAALDSGQIDVAAITEPLWSKVKNKYRAVVVASEVLPPLDNVVGVTTVEMAEKKGDFLRAVIRARRKAVKFMIANPDEAAEIVAKQYNIELDEIGRA